MSRRLLTEQLVIECKNNDKKTILELLEKGADINIGLRASCRLGNKDLINLMIEYGADNFNFGLAGACTAGNENIVNLMLKYGANDFNIGLFAACMGNQPRIMQLMIEKGATKIESSLFHACHKGLLDCVKLLVLFGAKRLKRALVYACKGDNKEIVLYLLPLINRFNIEDAIDECIDKNNRKLLLILFRYRRCIIRNGNYSDLELEWLYKSGVTISARRVGMIKYNSIHNRMKSINLVLNIVLQTDLLKFILLH